MTVKFEKYEDAELNDACCLKLSLMTTIHRNDSQAIHPK